MSKDAFCHMTFLYVLFLLYCVNIVDYVDLFLDIE